MISISARRFHRPLLSTLTFAALAGLAASTAARPAQACSPPQCVPPLVAPAAGKSLPGNLPGFPVIHERGEGVDGSAPLTVVELIDPAGAVVPTDERMLPDWVGLVAPLAPLIPGTYKLRWRETCSFENATQTGVPIPARMAEREVIVTAAQPLPTSIGTLSLETRRETYRVNANASCTADVSASVVRLTLQPSAELAPYLPVAKLSVVINGQRWASSLYGAVSVIPPSIYFAARTPLEIFAVCSAPSGGQSIDRGLAEGTHQAELRVEIPGAASAPAPVPFTFQLSCAGPADGGPTPPPHDGGAPTDVAGDQAAPTDGNTPAPDSSPPADGAAAERPRTDAGQQPPDDSGCGCDLGGRSSGGPGDALLALGALLAVLCRRTLRRP